VRIVCLSDTHNRHAHIDVPDGDVLLHAGDATMMGRPDEIAAFDRWLGTLPHKHKILVAGNHDWLFQLEPPKARSLITNAVYLEDAETVVEGLRVWGSPWQPWFMDWAFNLPRGRALADKWALVPTGIDILVTHGPPWGILDMVDRGENVGCADLLRELARIRPRLHLFGHIHEGYGRLERDGTHFVNASICTVEYRPTQAPVVVDL
jgi:predicted phosphohydrolase